MTREASKPSNRPDGMVTGVATGGQVTIRWIIRFSPTHYGSGVVQG